MSQEAPLDMDDVLEIIDPDDLLDHFDENEEHLNPMSDQEENEMEEDEEIEPYVPERDDAKTVFKEHKGSVFCCDIDKTGTYAITGGEDDLAYMWDLKTGEIKFTCKDHTDSVVSAKFNFDGSLVATGDMAGNVQVWKVATQERILQDMIGELTWMEWHPAINVVFAGAADGNVTFWRVNSGESKLLPSNGVSTEVGKVMPDGTRAAVGYEDGSVRIFDLRSCKCIYHIPGNEDPIKSLDCHRDNILVLAGADNGETKLINSKNGKLLGSMLCSDPDKTACVESIEFCPLENQSDLAACVTIRGDLSVWTVSRQEVRDAVVMPNDATKVSWSKTDRRLILATVRGDVHIHDGLSLTSPPKILVGHSATILGFCQSPDGKLLLTVSDDNTARVFEMPELESA